MPQGRELARSLPLFFALAASSSALGFGPEEEPQPREKRRAPNAAAEIWVEAGDPELGSIAARVPLPVESTPASVTVLGTALLVEQGATTLGAALVNAPGVAVHTNAGVHDYFVTRGFDSLSAALVLKDGAPEPEATFYHLYDLERVELLRGPSGVLHGGNPLAASVNLVSKPPRFERFGEIALGFGSFGTARGSLDLAEGDASGKLALRLNALAESADGYRDDRERRVLALHPSLTYRLTPEASLTLGIEQAYNRYLPDAGIPVLGDRLADVPRSRAYASPFDDSRQHVTRARAELTLELGEQRTLRNNFYITRLDWETRGTILSGAFPTPSGIVLARSLLTLDDRQVFLGNQLELSIGIGDEPRRHELLLGLELARRTDRFALDVGLLPTVDLRDPVETASAPPDSIPFLSEAGDARSLIVAPYVLDRFSISERAQLWGGLRLDRLDDEERLHQSERSSSEASPFAGVSYAAWQGGTLYLSGSRAFAAPSSRIVGPRRPERSHELELGARTSWLEGRLEASLAAYVLERVDIAIPDATGITRQLGSQLGRGFELEAEARPGESLRARLSYAFNDSELTEFREVVPFGPAPTDLGVVDRSGNQPAFAPRHLARLWVARRLPRGFAAALGARYAGRQFIAEDNAFAIDAVLLVDARLTWSANAWLVGLNVDNLTDREYETRGFGATSVIPGAPLSANAELRYRF